MAITIVGRGTSAKLAISTSNLLYTGAGRIARISVLTAGTTVGGVYDAATLATAVASAEVFVIPNVVGIYDVDWPVFSGIYIIPGTGQIVSASWMI